MNAHPSGNKLHNTEAHNPASGSCHEHSPLQNLQMLNAQNAKIHLAVERAIPAIDTLVTRTITAMKNGGRLFYIGAGTSGRLGVLDASEMPPTFGTTADLVQGIIAGGDHALRHAGESAEDSIEQGINDIAAITDKDILLGISASGSAVYVRGALQHAKQNGIYTAALCTASDAPLLHEVDCPILVDLIAAGINGEIPAGSTRMFSGTAQKMVLNMISTSVMIGLGKVYAGYMVDVMINNDKLVQRAIKMVMTLTGCNADTAQDTITQIARYTKNPVKPAVIMILEQCDFDAATKLLQQHEQRIDSFMVKHARE